MAINSQYIYAWVEVLTGSMGLGSCAMRSSAFSQGCVNLLAVCMLVTRFITFPKDQEYRWQCHRKQQISSINLLQHCCVASILCIDYSGFFIAYRHGTIAGGPWVAFSLAAKDTGSWSLQLFCFTLSCVSEVVFITTKICLKCSAEALFIGTWFLV